MATIFDMVEPAWSEWVDSRPEPVRTLCRTHPPNVLFRLKTTGHRVFIRSYSENGTVTVAVTGQFNRLAFERAVFGIDPKDLEECELPTDEEQEFFGVKLTPEEALAHINGFRVEHGLEKLTELP